MTNIPEAKAFTESAVLDLFAALKSADTPEQFLSQCDAILANHNNLLALPVNLGIPDMPSIQGTRAVDVGNAPLVHEYLGELKPADAADARLWNFLALGTYRSYMEKRWPLVVTGSDIQKWKGRVRDRWILPLGSVTRGKLVRHGISRLWWVAHLTYSPNTSQGRTKDDAYAYTREVFQSEDRLNAIFDREVGAFPSVRLAVLEHAANLGALATDKHIQRVMQYLKLVHGYRDFGVMERADIEGLIELAARHASVEGV